MRPVRDEWAEVDGLRFHYRDWGGSGQPIILLHGLASNCHWWDLVAPILAGEFRVVALDQRGHGKSDKPEGGYDFATVAGDLEGFRKALALDRPIIVGHSWGGDVALEHAVAYPGRAKGLCFVDGGMIEIASRPGYTLEQARIDMAPPDWAELKFSVDQLKERARRWRHPDGFGRSCGERSRTITTGMAQSQYEEILLSNFEVLADGTVRSRLSRANHLRIIEALWSHYPSKLYPLVQVPVLIMPARQQDETSNQERREGEVFRSRRRRDEIIARGRIRREESVARASKLLPNSKTVWLEDSIHDVPVQRPELVAGVIRDHITSGFFG